MTIPERSTPQRIDALGRANDVRIRRAALKGKIKRGEMLATQVIEHPPPYVLKMKVVDLLLAVPRMGTIKTRKLLGECDISLAKTIGGLSPRQRREVVIHVQSARLGTNHPEQGSRGL